MSVANPASSIRIFPDPQVATQVAAKWLVGQLAQPTIRNVMLAGGNTPLGLYAAVAQQRPDLGHVSVFALDEYVGVPLEEPRNCANLIRASAVEPWGVLRERYHWISSIESDAADSIKFHEEKIRNAGGLDLVILGLGRNGHVGFNEPGSQPNSMGRVIGLDPVSIEANCEWFRGAYAPKLGVTTGMQLILAAKQIMLLAFGAAKAPAVAAMLEGPPSSACPASLLQLHRNVIYVLDEEAAAELKHRSSVVDC